MGQGAGSIASVPGAIKRRRLGHFGIKTVLEKLPRGTSSSDTAASGRPSPSFPRRMNDGIGSIEPTTKDLLTALGLRRIKGSEENPCHSQKPVNLSIRNLMAIGSGHSSLLSGRLGIRFPSSFRIWFGNAVDRRSLSSAIFTR